MVEKKQPLMLCGAEVEKVFCEESDVTGPLAVGVYVIWV